MCQDVHVCVSMYVCVFECVCVCKDAHACMYVYVCEVSLRFYSPVAVQLGFIWSFVCMF